MTNITHDALRDLTQATLEFYKRFDFEPTVPDCVQNFKEEVAELIEAAQNDINKRHIAEEAADVFVTTIGLCYAAGVDIDMIIEQVYAVAAKNNAKTHETHVNINGKIRRRKG